MLQLYGIKMPTYNECVNLCLQREKCGFIIDFPKC